MPHFQNFCDCPLLRFDPLFTFLPLFCRPQAEDPSPVRNRHAVVTGLFRVFQYALAALCVSRPPESPYDYPAWPMLDDRPLPRDLEFAIQNKSPDALFARLWGYWPKPDFECLYYKLIGRLFQGMVLRMVLRILYYLPFRGTFPSLSYFF